LANQFYTIKQISYKVSALSLHQTIYHVLFEPKLTIIKFESTSAVTKGSYFVQIFTDWSRLPLIKLCSSS